MKRIVVNIGVFFISLCITLLGCAQIARNNVNPDTGGETKFGRQEVSARHSTTTQSTAMAENNKAGSEPSSASATQSGGGGPPNAAAKKVDCSAFAPRGTVYFKSPSGSNNKLKTVKVGATGYGAPPKNYYPEGQRRLMTIRASKLDAYRALAEIVGGLHIWGGSAISDMVIDRDRYRMFVDSFVRGAHVVSVEAMEDNTYKTIVEMEVDQRFLNHVMTFIDPATDRYCYEQQADGTTKYYGYTVAPSFYYSE